MANKTLAQESIKVSRRGPRGTQVTSADALSYQPEGCYTFPMIITADQELRDELEAWDAASDEALESTESME